MLKEFFTLNLADFENIGWNFMPGVFITLFTIIFIPACFVASYHKITTSRILSRIIRHEAVGEDCAKTLQQLRIDLTFGVRQIFVSRRFLTIVSVAGDKGMASEKLEKVEESNAESDKREEIDLSVARFYIEEKNLLLAKSLVAEDNSYVKPFVFSIVAVVIFVLLVFFLPDLAELLNALLAPDMQ